MWPIMTDDGGNNGGNGSGEGPSAFVGAGNHGCVVSRLWPCHEGIVKSAGKDPSARPGFLVKAVPCKGEAARELWIANRVRAVDPDSAFTLVPEAGWCQLEAMPNECHDYSSSWRPFTLVMANGGVPILNTVPGKPQAVATVLDGLAALAAAGIHHGDIYPDNVLVGADGTIRLIDFALGRVIATPAANAFHTDLCDFAAVVQEWYATRGGYSPAAQDTAAEFQAAVCEDQDMDAAASAALWRTMWGLPVGKGVGGGGGGGAFGRMDPMVLLRPRVSADDVLAAMYDVANGAWETTTTIPTRPSRPIILDLDYGCDEDVYDAYLAVKAAWDAFLSGLGSATVPTDDLLRAFVMLHCYETALDDTYAVQSHRDNADAFWTIATCLLPVQASIVVGHAGAAPDPGPVMAALQRFHALADPTVLGGPRMIALAKSVSTPVPFWE